MNFLYPRVVDIHRPSISTGVGILGYSGELPTTETVVATNVPANLQQKQKVRGATAGLPGDVQTSGWTVFIPLYAVPFGAIKMRDIIISELGERYIVVGNYWNSLGWKLDAQALTT